MTATKNQMDRLTKDLSAIAKEPVTTEQIASAFYAFGSEIACLRLFLKYNLVTRNEKTLTGYSENMKSFYFCIEQ